jgi:hypothetical protein
MAVVVVVTAGFVTCAEKHRAKDTTWQCFLKSDPHAQRSFSFCLHLMLVGWAVLCTPRSAGDRWRARSDAPYLRYVVSAVSLARHRQFLLIVASWNRRGNRLYIDEVGD